MVAHPDEVDQVLAGLLRLMVDQKFAVVLYDMTAIHANGQSQQDNVRKFGMSTAILMAHQGMPGVLQTADGLPLYHEVFDGNTAEVTTIKLIIRKIVQRLPVKNVIAVAGCGLLSTGKLADLQAITVPGSESPEFNLAVPGCATTMSARWTTRAWGTANGWRSPTSPTLLPAAS